MLWVPVETPHVQTVRSGFLLPSPSAASQPDRCGPSLVSSTIDLRAQEVHFKIQAFPKTDPYKGCVRFNAELSSDDGRITSYGWNFGELGTTGTGVISFHYYKENATYDVILTICDDKGNLVMMSK